MHTDRQREGEKKRERAGEAGTEGDPQGDNEIGRYPNISL
jgi:hypothetical protein